MTLIHPADRRLPLLLGAITLALAACSRSADPSPEPQPEVNARVAPAAAPLRYGDCVEARRRVAADPGLPVDRVPEPLAMRPQPFQKVPAKAWNKDGSAEVKAEVMVDTTGRADMTTFTVVTASNPWFAQNLRTVIPQWRFAPATVAGCKVRRVYKFAASVPSRAERAKAAAARTPARTPAKTPPKPATKKPTPGSRD